MLLVLVVVPAVLGLEISLSNDVYYPGETLQAEITGNFVSLKGENILVYKEGVPRPMPVISDLIRRDNIYYFYAILPEQVGNFSLVIDDSEYIEKGRLNGDDIVSEFIIGDVNRSALGIAPGFVRTEGDFSVDVKSLEGNLNVNAEFGGESVDLNLIEDVEQRVSFSATKDEELKIGDYEVPVFIKQKRDNFSGEKSDLVFMPSLLEGSVVAGKDYLFNVVVENIGEGDLTVKFSVENGEVEPGSVNLAVGDLTYLNISISVPKKTKENYTSEVVGSYENKEVKIPIRFEVTKKEINLSGTSFSESLSCSEQGGSICGDEEECIGEISPSLEGNCCNGNCVVLKESGYGFYIGIILLIIVIGIVGFFIWRARRKWKLKGSKDVLKERVEKGKERMEAKPSPEVSGKLGKV